MNDLDLIMAQAAPNQPDPKSIAKPTPPTAVEARVIDVPISDRGLEARSLDGLKAVANMYLRGCVLPANIFTDCPGDPVSRLARVCCVIEKGIGLGLAPSESLHQISFINGRLTAWGDALVALVQRHPQCRGIKTVISGEGDELAAEVTVLREGRCDVTTRFSVADAKRAGLWGKRGPWSAYPTRMLQQRARGFAIRDQFADALMGIISTEEAMDYDEPAKRSNDSAAEARARLNQ